MAGEAATGIMPKLTLKNIFMGVAFVSTGLGTLSLINWGAAYIAATAPLGAAAPGIFTAWKAGTLNIAAKGAAGIAAPAGWAGLKLAGAETLKNVASTSSLLAAKAAGALGGAAPVPAV